MGPGLGMLDVGDEWDGGDLRAKELWEESDDV